MTREELHQRIWPADTFVDFDNGLNGAINRLREALGDSAESPRFVETLPRRGYRFIAAVDEGVASIGGHERSPAPGSVTPGGASVSTEPGAAAPSPRPPELEEDRTKTTRVRYPLLVGGVAAAILLALLFGLNVGGLRERLRASAGRAAAGRIRSLAVLPLENLTGDPSQEYFADGMTEALITDLGKIGELRVISRTSVMRYKSSKKPLQDIARELKVDALVEGTVARSGDHVRITARLVQVEPEKHLWADSFERDLRNVVALQDDVSQAIVDGIRVRLTPQEHMRFIGAHAIDPDAVDAYLKGRHELTSLHFDQAIEHFEQAFQKEPNFAQAWAGLAESYDAQAYFVSDGSLSEDVTKIGRAHV